MGQDKSSFDSKMRSVMELMKYLNVPDDLERQVANFCESLVTRLDQPSTDTCGGAML